MKTWQIRLAFILVCIMFGYLELKVHQKFEELQARMDSLELICNPDLRMDSLKLLLTEELTTRTERYEKLGIPHRKADLEEDMEYLSKSAIRDTIQRNVSSHSAADIWAEDTGEFPPNCKGYEFDIFPKILSPNSFKSSLIQRCIHCKKEWTLDEEDTQEWLKKLIEDAKEKNEK